MHIAGSTEKWQIVFIFCLYTPKHNIQEDVDHDGMEQTSVIATAVSITQFNSSTNFRLQYIKYSLSMHTDTYTPIIKKHAANSYRWKRKEHFHIQSKNTLYSTSGGCIRGGRIS